MESSIASSMGSSSVEPTVVRRAGYTLSIFVEPVQEKYLCGYCGLVLRDPMQNNCGHRFCKSCVKQLEFLYNRGEAVKCQLCLDEGSSDEEATFKPDQTYADRAVFKEISKKMVTCSNEGCTFKSSLKDYVKHEDECAYMLIACPLGCGMKINPSKVEDHITTECNKNMTVCQYCDQELIGQTWESHMGTCLKYPLECEFCHKTGIPRDIMMDHQDRHCDSPQRTCPLGCHESIRREELDSHITGDLSGHLSALSRRISNLELFNQTSGPMTSLPANVELQTRFQHMDGMLNSIKEEVIRHASEIDAIGSVKAELIRRLPCLEEQLKILENVVVTLKGQIGAYEEFSQEILNRYLQAQKDKDSLEQKMASLGRTLALKDVALAEQELRIKALENTSYDGTLIWKITEFSKKLSDAQSGRVISFYSPCFYTSRNGYKMCSRIYPSGDGMGKSSHVSLFFVLMRGNNDALLPWPFKQKVTFMLLDQGHREHILDAFNPDQNSPSFQRPVSEMNIASGCPLFIPINHLLQTSDNEYVKDDTIFIKIIVDCSDLNNL
ncbi:TNF receptor-associated factor 2-like [Tubulanus polymorphus]|uniref:TNF receptor-associated factor 2-like n=1 Tax=Tubulanus polymorphus TaxID=672921 RepID=UPI003DA378BE